MLARDPYSRDATTQASASTASSPGSTRTVSISAPERMSGRRSRQASAAGRWP